MKYKFSLKERQFIGIDICRTTYETNIDIRRNTNLDILRKEITSGVCANLGIDNPADVTMDFTVCLKSEIALKYTDKNYTLVIHESGRIKRLPESFTVNTDQKESK